MSTRRKLWKVSTWVADPRVLSSRGSSVERRMRVGEGAGESWTTPRGDSLVLEINRLNSSLRIVIISWKWPSPCLSVSKRHFRARARARAHGHGKSSHGRLTINSLEKSGSLEKSHESSRRIQKIPDTVEKKWPLGFLEEKSKQHPFHASWDT